jgi:Asp-tRNA(Asn)/Glu-tRNA(Gln) amidotransferase A subunit family amidase
MSEILLSSANDLVKQLRSGDVSSVDVCKAYIERINLYEKDVKAWAYFDKKLLLEKAEEADEHRKSGKPLGSLHGLPIAVKDIFGTFDMPTECGSTVRKKMSLSQDSEVVSLLKSAGALIMGKTETTELAYFHPGKTTNPHDYTRTPGGSSSGSAAAVAAYMAPLSIGSQTNGSVIRPASYCGVVGYKPSYGLISRSGCLRQSNKLDHVGVFGRTVEDIALLSKVLIKKDLYDDYTINY